MFQRKSTLSAPAWLAMAVALVSLLLSSCGTRVSDGQASEQLASAYSGTGVPGAEGGAGEELSTDAGVSTGAEEGANSADNTGAGTSGEIGSDSAAAGGGSDSSTSGAGSGEGDGGTSDAGSGEGDGGTSGAGSGATIVIGMSGNFSGVIGAAFAPSRDSYAAWVKSVNDRGGIHGHPIELLIADNQNSASQDLANVKHFVEEEGAIALVNMFPASGADESVEEYARSQNVPIVGGAANEPIWGESPVMFPTVSMNGHDYGLAKAIKDAGKTTAAAIYCTEVPACKGKTERWADHAEGLGIDVVYESGASVAQPDFTAQCVEARNRGVEALMTMMDGASSNRIAQACDRQGYHPLLVNPYPFSDVPSYAEGMVGVIPPFPWFVTSGSPALEEYGDAISKYVSSNLTTSTSYGWIGGKLLEKALEHGVSAKPTSQDVFEGLWAMKNETLGGLTPPITFNEGQPATEIQCVYSIVAKGGEWTAPSGVDPNLCM